MRRSRALEYFRLLQTSCTMNINSHVHENYTRIEWKIRSKTVANPRKELKKMVILKKKSYINIYVMIWKPYCVHLRISNSNLASSEVSRNWFELLIIDVHLPIEMRSKSQQWRQSSIL